MSLAVLFNLTFSPLKDVHCCFHLQLRQSFKSLILFKEMLQGDEVT
jgi:hypothetical protein